MTIVSSKEFVTDEDKYFDLALEEEVFVKKGDNMFVVQNYIPNDEPDILCEPNDDFYRSITMEEAIIRVEAGMREIIKKHKHAEVV